MRPRTADEEEARLHFQALSPRKKAEHILTYYRWAFVLALIVLGIAGWLINRARTQREPILYAAGVGVVMGDDLEARLTDGFLNAAGADSQKQSVYLYQNLYLSEDASSENLEYAYASRMKLMGAVSAEQLDVVLMNRESYDILSREGYLMDLTGLLPEGILPTQNSVVLSDNELEYLLNEAETYEEETVLSSNGVDMSEVLKDYGLTDTVYLGIIRNTPRADKAAAYLAYLFSE